MKVSHPNPKITQKEALEQLYGHPQFPKGAKLVQIEKKDGHWEAELELPKSAGRKKAAPFDVVDKPDDLPESNGPDTPEDIKDETPEDKSDESKDDKGDEKDDSKDEKVDLDKIFDLVKQIADQVGVPIEGDISEGPGDALDEALEDGPLGEDLPPLDEEPPKDDKPKKPLRPGETPPSVTPVGAPAFAKTKVPHPIVEANVATFDVKNVTSASLKEAEREINDIYGPFGYKVKQMHEASSDNQGKREVRARISKR